MHKLPQSVLKRLQETLPAPEQHPDPDLLTAFAESSLPADERVPVINHLAHCKDCRDILAIAASAVEFPNQSVTLPAAGAAPSPWFLWPAFRWAALAAGVLIVVSVGILQYGHHHQTTQVASTASSGQMSLSSPSRASDSPVDQKPAQNEPVQNDGANARKTPTIARRADSRNAPESAKEAEIRHESRAARSQATPGDLDVSGAQTELAQNQSGPQLSIQGPDVVKAKNPVPSESGAVSPAPRPHSLQTVSPANFRWAIKAGVLQRSMDEGENWQSVNPNPSSPAEFLAIAVNGLEVWVGGSGASLYHSVDAGARWAAVTPSANGASLTGNVIGIQFSDPLHGKIATSTSENWITSDAGQTWVKQ